MQVPAETPVTIPEDAPTVIAVHPTPVDHDPPVVASVSVIVDPSHTWVSPPIAAGTGFTVTSAVL